MKGARSHSTPQTCNRFSLPKVSLSILQERLHNRASRLTEDFMIAVNQATAGFLDQRGGRAEQQKPNGLEPEDNGVAPAE